jgi:Tfp pilus assembly protein PilF
MSVPPIDVLLPTRERAVTTETHAHVERVKRLERCVRWALRRGVPACELISMLRPLVACTRADEPEGRAARLQLGHQLLRLAEPEVHAWEAASIARSTLHGNLNQLDRAEALGIVGIALTALGYYRAAQASYTNALALDPDNPVLAHNLGHLLCARLGDPSGAIPWLRKAHRLLRDDPEITASYAHGLCKVGQLARATKLLTVALGKLRHPAPDLAAQSLVLSWRR